MYDQSQLISGCYNHFEFKMSISHYLENPHSYCMSIF